MYIQCISHYSDIFLPVAMHVHDPSVDKKINCTVCMETVRQIF
jgi:hypothetical protein